MAYTVLARKYRSRTFDEVVGQDPIATTLKNAIKAGRIHHGYLFTGTRGVGKTSMARILAKALNCLNADGPTAEPCLKCEACLAIAEGQDIDVVEIDAASNTGVDNIRELRSNAAYRPARSRFKIYIIDEVHMLSTGAFNALLKTLEEPPAHVKFILATTELQKVPATIQSRCQRFNFQNISVDAIEAALAHICKQEETKAESGVLARVARLGNGSMRDALSILDQLLSISPDKLSMSVLNDVLPPPQNEQLCALLGCIANGDAAATLAKTEEILSGGRGIEVFCAEFIELLRSLMHAKAAGKALDTALAEDQVALAKQFELSHFVQMIAMLEELRRNVRYSAAGRALADATMVRFAKLREWSSIEDLLKQLDSASDESAEKKKSAAIVDVAPVASRKEMPVTAPEPIQAKTAVNPTAPVIVPQRDTANAGPTSPTTAPAPRGKAAPAHPQNGHVSSRQPIMPAGLSDSEMKKMLDDPMINEVMELFDGVLVHAKRTGPAIIPEAAADAEDDSAEEE
ncbi:MAG: DNA polymerase III subunit gamma/tau [Phycisphaerae bacterium]